MKPKLLKNYEGPQERIASMRISRALKHYHTLRKTLLNKTHSHILRQIKYTRLSISKQELKNLCNQSLDSHFGFSLHVIGSFTKPPWSEKILMQLEKEEYSVTLKMQNNEKFKFVLTDHASDTQIYFCSEQYQKIQDNDGIINNLPILNRKNQEEVEEQKFESFQVYDFLQGRDNKIIKHQYLNEPISECTSELTKEDTEINSVHGSSRNDSFSSSLCLTQFCIEDDDTDIQGNLEEDKVKHNEFMVFKSAGYMIGKTGYEASTLDSKESQDAYVLNPKGIALADGVSNWNKFGINAGKFAHQIVQNCGELFEKELGFPSIYKRKKFSASFSNILDTVEKIDFLNDELFPICALGPPDPLKILAKAFSQTASPGSSTSVVIMLHQHYIHCANLGDSGFMIFRLLEDRSRYQLLKKSTEQQHEFNKPRQLTRIPQEKDFQKLQRLNMFAQARILRKKLAQSEKIQQDTPEDADSYKIKIKEGDLVLVMTDGVTDNLFNHEIQSIVNTHIKQYEIQDELSAGVLSEKISKAAQNKFKSKKGRSPFSEKYRKQYRTIWNNGGKEDDITVVAAFIGFNLY